MAIPSPTFMDASWVLGNAEDLLNPGLAMVKAFSKLENAVVIPGGNVILCKKTLRNFSVIGLAFAVILLQRLFEDRVIGLCCQNKMF